MNTPASVARNVVHRAHQFVSAKKLKGAEDYLIARFHRHSMRHDCRKNPRVWMQSWLFDFLVARKVVTLTKREP